MMIIETVLSYVDRLNDLVLKDTCLEYLNFIKNDSISNMLLKEFKELDLGQLEARKPVKEIISLLRKEIFPYTAKGK